MSTASASFHTPPAGLGRKLARAAGSAAREVLRHALELYFAARSPQTPSWARSTIYGALAYFISTVDGLPDLTPLIGYSDDLAVLAAAAATVAAYIGPDERARARAALRRMGLEPDPGTRPVSRRPSRAG